MRIPIAIAVALSLHLGLGVATIYGGIISWHASSGVLPSDASIPEDGRFEMSARPGYVSLSGGMLTIDDASTVWQAGFNKFYDAPLENEWAYQIELRMNTHSRPVEDYGAVTGIRDRAKSGMLAFATDRVGIPDDSGIFGAGSFLMDTTDDFHVYRVVHQADTVLLYVDTFDSPVLSVQYADLSADPHPLQTQVILTQSSTPGVANFDIRSFAFNLEGTAIPEPATLLLLAMGGLTLMRRCRQPYITSTHTDWVSRLISAQRVPTSKL